MLPRSPTVRFLIVERGPDTAHSESNSCKFFRVASISDLRVPQDVNRQPLDVREHGQGMGPQAKGSRCRQRRFFQSSAGIADPHQCKHCTSYKNSCRRLGKHLRVFQTESSSRSCSKASQLGKSGSATQMSSSSERSVATYTARFRLG